VNTNSVLASAYVDIPTNSRWVPYIGGGLGYTNVGWGAYSAIAFGVTLTQTPGSQGVFGYQAKLGLSYLASRNADLFVEGTYQGAAGFTIDRVNYDPLNSWGARLGARYRF
jgi:opacity protein-like surface antigen